jgi:polyphosphate:AMP phosphotransferase
LFKSAELDQRVSKQEYAEREPALRAALLAAQARLGDSNNSLVIVIAGAEGSGKGEAVNTLLEWLDARGIEAHALGEPSSEEAERPRFYRFWRRLPPRGQIGIFFGSWYTAPIVRRSLGDSDSDELDRELDRIADFERMLADEGVLLVKLWLHITKKRQKKVFEKLASDPDTAWRVTERDWEFHRTYDAFITASSRALRRTDTPHAPWHVIGARDARHRQLAVGDILLEALESRLAAAPVPMTASAPLPAPARVNVLNSLDLGLRLEREAYDERLASLQGRIGRLARDLTASKRAAVLLFEGVDAAGKGGCIRRIVHAIDARWYVVVPIAAPSDEERARPYLWRFWRRLPGRGQFTIYDRSWYGRVLVDRIEGFAAAEAWRRAYAEINAFEEQLVDAGILVFKFWLQISPDEQLRRFAERGAIEHKRYKLTPEDWRNREKWLAYEAAACEMIERTSTESAPWHLVPAEDKLPARVQVLETLRAGLESAIGAGRRSPKRRGKQRR